MPILTPSIHATNYSPDDNRFDQRPFLYPWFPGSYQITLIKSLASKMMDRPDVIALMDKGSVAALQVQREEDEEKERQSKSFKEKFEKREENYKLSRPDTRGNILATKPVSYSTNSVRRAREELASSMFRAPRSQNSAVQAAGRRRVTRNKAREQRRRTAKFGNLN